MLATLQWGGSGLPDHDRPTSQHLAGPEQLPPCTPVTTQTSVVISHAGQDVTGHCKCESVALRNRRGNQYLRSNLGMKVDDTDEQAPLDQSARTEDIWGRDHRPRNLCTAGMYGVRASSRGRSSTREYERGTLPYSRPVPVKKYGCWDKQDADQRQQGRRPLWIGLAICVGACMAAGTYRYAKLPVHLGREQREHCASNGTKKGVHGDGAIRQRPVDVLGRLLACLRHEARGEGPRTIK